MNPNAFLAGLGALQRAPLAQAAIRYWWLTVPLAYLAWHHYQARRAAGKIKAGDLVADMAPAVSIAVSLIMLDRCMAGASPMQGLDGLGVPLSGPVQHAVPVHARVVPADVDPLLTSPAGMTGRALPVPSGSPPHGFI